MENFTEWLEGQLRERQWKPADLARASGIRDSSLSKILNGTRNAGVDACKRVAKAFNLPEDVIFRKAGLLEAEPEMDQQAKILLHYYDQLARGDRARLLSIAKTLSEQRADYVVD